MRKRTNGDRIGKMKPGAALWGFLMQPDLNFETWQLSILILMPDLSLNFSLPVVCTAIRLKWLYEAYLWQRFDFMGWCVLVAGGKFGFG